MNAITEAYATHRNSVHAAVKIVIYVEMSGSMGASVHLDFLVGTATRCVQVVTITFAETAVRVTYSEEIKKSDVDAQLLSPVHTAKLLFFLKLLNYKKREEIECMEEEH